jgi:CpXC protein
MSRSTNGSFTCPCGTVFTSPIYEYVNVAHDPSLRYTILAGLLNVSTCPSCGRRAALARPFIYSDPSYALLAYVHPSANVPDEARMMILEKLRAVYMDAGETTVNVGSTTGTTASATKERDLPNLHVLFGLDQLNELISAAVSQDDRLGRLALSTYSRNEAERGQMLDIARKLASEMQCQVEVEDQGAEYTVWLYGSRRQIGALMRELAPRG